MWTKIQLIFLHVREINRIDRDEYSLVFISKWKNKPRNYWFRLTGEIGLYSALKKIIPFWFALINDAEPTKPIHEINHHVNRIWLEIDLEDRIQQNFSYSSNNLFDRK